MHVSPAMLRGLDGLPQDQVAAQLAQRLGVRQSVAAAYLMKGPQLEPREVKPLPSEDWRGTRTAQAAGRQARSDAATKRRALVVALFNGGMSPPDIADKMKLRRCTINAYLREAKRDGALIVVPPPVQPVTTATIKRAVAEVTGHTVEQLNGLGRKPKLAQARQIAFWLAVRDLGMSTVATGNRFNRDHTTVLHGIARIDGTQNEPDVAAIIEAARVRIRQLVGTC